MNEHSNSRRGVLGFSIAGSLLVILFFAFINFTVGGSFPWFIYPTFAVIWWPLGVFFARRSMKIFSLVGSLATIALLFFTNYYTSWSYPWFIFPSFAIIWWPLAVFFGAKRGKTLAVAGCIVIIAFACVTNHITSPEYHWWYYPVFAVIWWPLSVYFARTRAARVYSVTGAMLILTFLAVDNYLNVPSCPWTLLVVYPVLLWPTCVFLGRRASSLGTAVSLSSLGIAYYVLLNILVFPGFPWAIFPAYALLWWPLGIAFGGREHTLLFSVGGTLLSAVLFIATNVITSPHTIWAIYPIFALIWWPLSIYYFVYKPGRYTASRK